jgi:hypothetical protein
MAEVAGWQVLERREGPDGPALRLRCAASGPALWVPGRHVLAVFAVGDEWIVFSDHDIPQEELLELSLVSAGVIAERVSLAFPGWTSAGFSALTFPPGGAGGWSLARVLRWCGCGSGCIATGGGCRGFGSRLRGVEQKALEISAKRGYFAPHSG